MGCGRVGSSLARTLEDTGHSVAIVDRDESAFRRLPSSFLGRRIVGVGFDRETLVAAGIEEAFAFAAVSSGDNSNILSARVARETYGVERVVTCAYTFTADRKFLSRQIGRVTAVSACSGHGWRSSS